MLVASGCKASHETEMHQQKKAKSRHEKNK